MSLFLMRAADDEFSYASLSEGVVPLSDGTYGTAFQALNRDRQRVLVKSFPMCFFRNRRPAAIITQLRKFKELKHPGLVQITGFVHPDVTMPTMIGVVSEYCTNGSLKDLFKHKEAANQIKWDATRKTITVYWLSLTMAYLHHHNIVHGFLKPSNVLFDRNFDPKISDFWVSSVIESDSAVRVTEPNGGFKTPETFVYKLHGKKTDVFAWGEIVYEILLGGVAFGDRMGKIVEYHDRPSLSKSTPSAYVELLVKCLDSDASARPSMASIAERILTDDSFIIPGSAIDELAEYRRKMLSSLIAGSFLVGCTIGYSKEMIEDLKKTAEAGNVMAQMEYARLCERGDFVTKNAREAVKFYEMAAKKDNTSALFRLGTILSKGLGVKKDTKMAVVYFKRAADSGNVSAQFEYAILSAQSNSMAEAQKYFDMALSSRDADILYQYATMLLQGKVLPKNEAEGLRYLGEAAEGGCTQAQYEYGKMLMEGTKVPRDEPSGIRFLHQAAEKGNTDAQLLYSQIFVARAGWEPPGEEEAMGYLRLAAAQHNIDALLLYGDQNMKGKHMARNLETAKSYYGEAAYLGSTQGQCKYADLLLEQRVNNEDEIMRYYKKAWDGGLIDGMVGYAEMLLNTKCKLHNEREGMNLLKKAAQQGSARAQCQLGRKYMFSATPKNTKEGVRYIMMAAEQGYGPAIHDYAYLLKDGRYLPKNVAEALRILKAAADKDERECCYLYGKMLCEGDCVPADRETGLKYLRWAYRMGEVEADKFLGSMYSDSEDYFDSDSGDVANMGPIERRASRSDVTSLMDRFLTIS